MNINRLQSTAKSAPFSGIVIARAVVVLVSDLPEAIWQALAGPTPTWLFWVKVGVLLLMIMLGWARKQPYSLRSFFILLLILAVGRKAIRWLRMTPSYLEQGGQTGWLLQMAALVGMELLLVAVMVTALFVMRKRRQDFFLVKGDLEKWKLPGIVLALSIMVLTFFFFEYDLPSAATLLKALPLMPAALLFAAFLAFNEEMLFRATLLSSLHDVIGKDHAIMITAFLFGISHYFGGTPSGAEGALIAAALGWLWATIMLETRGVLMPWFIHFLNNAPTLVFWAIAATPG